MSEHDTNAPASPPMERPKTLMVETGWVGAPPAIASAHRPAEGFTDGPLSMVCVNPPKRKAVCAECRKPIYEVEVGRWSHITTADDAAHEARPPGPKVAWPLDGDGEIDLGRASDEQYAAWKSTWAKGADDPPGTDMRRVERGEIVLATDRLSFANGGALVPQEWIGHPHERHLAVFRGVPLGEPTGPEGPTGVDGPSCPAGEPGPMADVRGNSFFGEPGPTGTVGCSCAGAAGVMGPPLQPGEELVDWVGDGGAPWGKCVGCGAAFTAAGGLPGGFCVRCAKAKRQKVVPEEIPTPAFLREGPTGLGVPGVNDDLAAFGSIGAMIAEEPAEPDPLAERIAKLEKMNAAEIGCRAGELLTILCEVRDAHAACDSSVSRLEGMAQKRRLSLPERILFMRGMIDDYQGWLAEAEQRFASFKDYIHGRLDAWGVPEEIDGEQAEKGCRIGGRLDFVRAHMAPRVSSGVNVILAFFFGALVGVMIAWGFLLLEVRP